MKYLFILILLFGFLKSIFYGFFEIKEKQNKSGGILVIFLSLIGLILPSTLLLLLF